MDIEYRQNKRKWVVEVWSDNPDPIMAFKDFKEPYPEDTYIEINAWCLATFGYHARTAYNIFELKNKKHMNWFLLRWS